MSSIRSDIVAQAEFFTSTHRIIGEVPTGPKPLSDLLNDQSQSYLLAYNVYLSRLNTPGEIDAHAPVAYLSKANLSIVIVSSRETRSPDQGRFTEQEYEALATLPGIEVRGRFAGPRRIDLRSFSPAAIDPFLVLTGATALLTDLPEQPFQGDAILVSRSRLESLCLTE
jgi:hypothetical protein